ncbi:hypothetical protein [Chryseobacterium taichungense]|uniref:hypothetical protein n=1 Tax=Chryseobacterium taichungense TaxID=295069 RepID=UPI0028A8CDD1|nr:hypothetical protein [Chryseobacterium taichungense]
MDEKVKEGIRRAVAFTPIMSLLPGMVYTVRKAEYITAQKRRLIDLIGSDKAEEVYDKLKEEECQQHRDNGDFILERLQHLCLRLQSGEIEYVDHSALKIDEKPHKKSSCKRKDYIYRLK